MNISRRAYNAHTMAELRAYVSQEGAFGDPEGFRAALESFIDFSLREAVPDLVLLSDALKTRVLVGRKGSGKTLYLRKLNDRAVQDPSLLAEPIEDQQTLVGTRHVNKVDEWQRAQGPARADRELDTELISAMGEWYPEEIITEIWMLIWNRAILASLASRVLFQDLMEPHTSKSMRGKVQAQLGRLRVDLQLGESPRTPFSFVKHFIQVVDEIEDGTNNPRKAGKELRFHLDDIAWDDLATLLTEALREAPPIFMYIDAIDEEFAHRPRRWLRCQKGLFYATMRLLRSQGSLGGRLHLVIAIRDIVLSSVFQSEHATRYRGSSHIRSLNWDRPSIRAFLQHKIGGLPLEHLPTGRRRPNSLADWVGLDRIQTRSGAYESVEDFALRHTQILPRDVIVLGNQIDHKMRDVREAGRNSLTENEFRRVVEQVGAACGLTQLVIAANQAAAEGKEEDDRKPAERETAQRSRDEYDSSRLNSLVSIISPLGQLRFGPQDLEYLRTRGREVFGCVDLPSILWQAGLIGYSDDEQDVFHRNDFASSFVVPLRKQGYVFHPTMRECLGLEPVGRLVTVF